MLLALESASCLLTVAEHHGLFEGPSDRAMLAQFREMDEMGLAGRGNL